MKDWNEVTLEEAMETEASQHQYTFANLLNEQPGLWESWGGVFRFSWPVLVFGLAAWAMMILLLAAL